MGTGFFVTVLDLLLPRFCALCASPLGGEGGPTSPLCPSCRDSFEPLPEPRCACCGRSLVSEELLCLRCREARPPFEGAFPIYPYRGPAGALVVAWKLGGRPGLTPLVADLMEGVISARWPDHVLVPVPPRSAALRERGWDQIELLCRELGRRGLPAARVLRRGSSAEQKTLGLEARKENARRAFALLPGAQVPPKALVIDDVLTSGATAEACARALREGGAVETAFVSLAAD